MRYKKDIIQWYDSKGNTALKQGDNEYKEFLSCVDNKYLSTNTSRENGIISVTVLSRKRNWKHPVVVRFVEHNGTTECFNIRGF